MSEGKQYGPKKSIRNWNAYNNGLKDRYDISLYFEDESIFDEPPPKGERGGQQTYSDGYIELGLTLKAAYRLPYRGLEGFIRGLLKMADLNDKPVPHYSTFCDRAKTIEIERRLTELKGQKIHVLVDSTGLKIYGEGEWKIKMHGKTKRRTWRKLHLGIDEATQLIVIDDLTHNNVGDQEHLPKLLNAVPDDINISRVTADGIYDTWGCYDAANDHGAELVTPPRKNATEPPDDHPRQNHPRSDTVRECERLGREEWKKKTGYHRRSLAETAMYRYKTSCGEKMYSREFKRQRAEAKIKVSILNRFRQQAAPEYALAA